MRVAIFKRPPRAQFLTKSKNFCAHQIENYLEIILGFEIFEKGHSQPELRTIKVWSQIGTLFAPFLHHPSLFLAFTVFTSIVYFFWSFPFKPPLKNPSRRDSGPAGQHCYAMLQPCWASVPPGRIFEGGLQLMMFSFNMLDYPIQLEETVIQGLS